MAERNAPPLPSPVAQLAAELGRIRALLLRHIGADTPHEAAPPTSAQNATFEAVAPDSAPPKPGQPTGAPFSPSRSPVTPLDHLCDLFGFDTFERDALLMCAGCELDAPFAALCRRAAVDSAKLRPTFGLLLATLPNANWAALAPHAPLRRWQFLRVYGERALADAELTIDEPVLHYLLDGSFWDPSLSGLMDSVRSRGIPTSSQSAFIERILGVWNNAEAGALPVIQLVGSDPTAGLELLAALGTRINTPVLRIDAALLPNAATDLQTKLLAWQRFARIEGAIGILDAASHSPDRALASDPIAFWLEAAKGPIVLLTRSRRVPGARTWVTFELEPPKPTEQSEIWNTEIQRSFPNVEIAALAPFVERLVGTFNLAAGRIRSACADARGMLSTRHKPGRTPKILPWNEAVWHACRIQARPDLDAFAQRLEGGSTFADLCLDPRTTALLRRICDQVRLRGVVHGRWGVGGKTRRGLGIAALFAGGSGTGKTLAAEVLGNELSLDVYRVDLSAVVSKYIGETEKNLARVFDAAEGSGVVLLFDEADALFGKRTEVKDSHDRHANVEIGYLLQRLEAYHGLAILTTNLREDLDQAFLRRLRFIVEFPHPNMAERRKLWERALSGNVPVAALNLDALAALPLTGGQVRNIVINAAFAAATQQTPINHPILRDAIGHELEKHGQRLTNAELVHLGRANDPSVGGPTA